MRKHLRKKNIITFNNSNNAALNAEESSSNSAQILIQMQMHIEQLEEQCCQQNLKIEKSDQFKETKKKFRQ